MVRLRMVALARSRDLATVLLTLWLPLLQPAWAGCCDDFWSCAAAVATLGASCAVTGFISTVNGLIHKAEELRKLLSTFTGDAVAKAQQEVEGTASRVTAEAQALQAKMSSTEKFAIEVTRWPVRSSSIPGTSGNSATKHEEPVADATIETELKVALGAVKQLRLEGKELTALILLRTQRAQEEAAAGAQSAQNLPETTAPASLDEVKEWLQRLLTQPDNISDPSSAVDSMLDRISNDLDRLAEQIANAVTVKAAKELQGTVPLLKQATEVATRERRITNAMEDLQLARTAQALQLLYELVPPPDMSQVAIEARAVPGGAINSRLRAREAAAAPSLDVGALLANLATSRAQLVAVPKQRLQELTAAVAGVMRIGVQARASQASLLSYQENFRAKLDAHFAGKSSFEAARLRDQLLGEARARYANDQATRDAVINLITEGTSSGSSLARLSR